MFSLFFIPVPLKTDFLNHTLPNQNKLPMTLSTPVVQGGIAVWPQEITEPSDRNAEKA